MADITVITASPAKDLVDLATVKDILGITDASQDAALALYIAEATDMAQNYCNRIFAKERLRERHRRKLFFDSERGVYTFSVSRPPIEEIFEIKNPDATVIPTHAYEIIDADAGLIGLSAYEPYWGWRWWCAPNPASPYRIEIDYTGGFNLPLGAPGTPALPAGLGRGAIEFVKNVQTTAARQSDVTMEKIGDYTVRYESQSDLISAANSGGGGAGAMGSQLTSTVVAALAPYKIWVAG